MNSNDALIRSGILRPDVGNRADSVRVEIKNRIYQGARVGMFGVGSQRFAGKDLHDLPLIHHRDLMRDGSGQGDIMADESVCDLFFTLQTHQKTYDVLLN